MVRLILSLITTRSLSFSWHWPLAKSHRLPPVCSRPFVCSTWRQTKVPRQHNKVCIYICRIDSLVVISTVVFMLIHLFCAAALGIVAKLLSRKWLRNQTCFLFDADWLLACWLVLPGMSAADYVSFEKLLVEAYKEEHVDPGIALNSTCLAAVRC